MDDEGVKERVLLLTPNVLEDAGVGVGISASVTDTIDWSRLIKEGGFLRGLCSCSVFCGVTTMSESV